MASGVIDAFILAVVIVVVAIPEGLPLAVTISLAYSTKKMYLDNCFIRVLAACETMGNATNICSDKTGTLTENIMTAVEGWFGDIVYGESEFIGGDIPPVIKRIVAEHVCINRVAYLLQKDNFDGKVQSRPQIIGNKTEGALLLMARSWGFDYVEVMKRVFDDDTDKVFAFNSSKKRSTAVIHRPDGSVRLFCKGASELLLKDCTMYLGKDGKVYPMSNSKREQLQNHILNMAQRALRTLLIAHKDYTLASQLPSDWRDHPPDNAGLCCDCIVGIIDPLREDVKTSVATAQRAGVTVRMVTGDNIETACAIARQCGILTEDGIALEGPVFRTMTPAQVDAILPNLQVLARSSPEDKFLLVCRLNGYALPEGEEEWMAKHGHRPGVTWQKEKDILLPGHREEWLATRPEGGEVVGVTGDGTNDAPALKAADVGLSMGITGTKVAQFASDIVILDDQFSSIVTAISWGRTVYDNIRKFLQFQLTVNVVALTLAFIGAVAGYGQPINAVMMLWVNLVMDTMGALALGTELPTPELLHRRPYKRSASLISRPMWRNILCQSAFQLILLLYMLFNTEMFVGNHYDPDGWCSKYSVQSSGNRWNPYTGVSSSNSTSATVSCAAFSMICPHQDGYCFQDDFHSIKQYNLNDGNPLDGSFKFSELKGFQSDCLKCTELDYTMQSLIFNAFIFCQLFNEVNSRSLFDDIYVFKGLHKNSVFVGVILATIGTQIILINFGGAFVKTSPISLTQWGITIGLGAISLVIGFLSKFIPIKEDPNTFFRGGTDDKLISSVHSLKSSKSPTSKNAKNNNGSSSNIQMNRNGVGSVNGQLPI